jgi:hypothetical protein
MSTTVSEAVKGFTYSELRHYIVTRFKINTPGKGMKQLIATISDQENVGSIVKELQRYKQILDKEKDNISPTKKAKRKRIIIDDDNDNNNDSEEEDDAMIMLKEELALRGLTTKGKSYPFLITRLIKALREE